MSEQSGQFVTNSSENIEKKKPTETNDKYYLYHADSDIEEAEFDSLDEIELGKWMMFFNRSELDQKWENCCNLYDAGKLNGIGAIHCSTNLIDPRASIDSMGVILFHCGPASDESKMLEYGKNLLKFIPYFSNYGFMAFKSQLQTLKGTRKTGETKNWLYKLPVPKFQDGPNSTMQWRRNSKNTQNEPNVSMQWRRNSKNTQNEPNASMQWRRNFKNTQDGPNSTMQWRQTSKNTQNEPNPSMQWRRNSKNTQDGPNSFM